MKRLTGLRYLVPLREGGSLPAVIETDEPGAYVVKFRGAGQGVKALIAEALAAELALLLGLPVPAPALVDLDAGFGESEPDPEIQDILRGSVGTNFGLAYLAGALAFDPAADRTFDADFAAEIVWFDAFITNVDRTARNTNLLYWRGAQYLIDHGASLYFHHRSGGWESIARARFPAHQGSRPAALRRGYCRCGRTTRAVADRGGVALSRRGVAGRMADRRRAFLHARRLPRGVSRLFPRATYRAAPLRGGGA